MRRGIPYILYIVLLLPAVVLGQESSICDLEGVQGFRFGMTIRQAIQMPLDWHDTTLQPLMSDDYWDDFTKTIDDIDSWYESMAVHDATFGNWTALGLPKFVNGVLAGVNYLFGLNTQNENKYVDHYYELKSLLSLKYGEPQISHESLSGIYKNEPLRGDRAGFAVSIGSGLYKSQWSCSENNTYIILALSGDNRVISLLLRYFDEDYDVPREDSVEALLDDF